MSPSHVAGVGLDRLVRRLGDEAPPGRVGSRLSAKNGVAVMPLSGWCVKVDGGLPSASTCGACAAGLATDAPWAS